jgi:hypothetical protein
MSNRRNMYAASSADLRPVLVVSVHPVIQASVGHCLRSEDLSSPLVIANAVGELEKVLEGLGQTETPQCFFIDFTVAKEAVEVVRTREDTKLVPAVAVSLEPLGDGQIAELYRSGFNAAICATGSETDCSQAIKDAIRFWTQTIIPPPLPKTQQ